MTERHAGPASRVAQRYRSYCRQQRAAGRSAVGARLRYPFHELHRAYLNLRYPTYRRTLTGFGRHDLPLLASYSRSGTNWLRYYLETVTGRPTPGQHRVHSGTDFCIDRAHRAYPIMHRHPRVVLVLRDYRECLLRHHMDTWSLYPDPVTFLEDEGLEQPAAWYIRNLAAFDAFDGDKHLLYYEDLITDPVSQFPRLAAFLGFEPDATRAFVESLDHHRQASIGAYTGGGHRSESASSGDLRHHAKTQLSADQATAFDDFYFTRYPELAGRYLARYDTRDSC